MSEREMFALKGCGGHARSVADAIVADSPRSKIVFVDDNAKDGERIMGFDAVSELPGGADVPFIPAIGDNARRMSECEGLRLRSYVSRTAHVGAGSRIEEGCFVGCGAHIGPEATIGRGSIVNTNAVVEHNVVVGRFCHVAPNATVCGMCRIGDLVLIGAGAVVRPCVSICPNVVVGAGAVVVADIAEPGTYAGCPARKAADR